jgi:NAD(P)-dependent dehydrogenase (short-subunit alcohol dehydrogenase family)
MMRTVAVTGSASGIGAAIRSRLERDGGRIIGVDLRDADVRADLATPGGRDAAVAAIERASGGVLDGVVACAGVGPQVEDRALIVSLNYFGAQRLLDGLRGALARGTAPAAVAISSNSSTIPTSESPLVGACLDGDEETARRLAATLFGGQVYGGAKLALTRWLRRRASSSDWAGAGIRLNAVAPGPVQTPLLQAGLDDAVYGPAIRGFPIPTGAFGSPDDVAAAVAFLLGPEARFCCGSVLFVDGGTDALLRPDQY